MEIIRQLNSFPRKFTQGAVSIGNFDGVHLGHRELVSRLKHWAAQVEGPAIVFTFDPHPRSILRPDSALPPLTWVERKAELLSEIGVDAMIACPTTRSLLEMSYDRFFEEIVLELVGAKALIEGPNFFFGRDRQGGPSELQALCQNYEIELEIVAAELESDSMVSSSRIRQLLQIGSIEDANKMLVRAYRIRGQVERGAGRGHDLGFPTANLTAIDTLIPQAGVYAGRAIVDGQQLPAAIHVGSNPTFQDDQNKVEVHILKFEQQLYGKQIQVVFDGRLRGITKFDSREQLIQQIQSDLERVEQVFHNHQH